MKKFIEGEIKNLNMRPRKFAFILLGFIFLGIFITLSLIEEFGGFLTLDPFLTETSQVLIPRSFDSPLSFFSILGSIEITTLLLVIAALILFKKEKLIPYSLGLFALVMVLELIGKFFIYHPSPPKEFFRYTLPFTTPHYIGSTYSFPSGHVARTFFLVVVGIVLIWKYIPRRLLRGILVGSLVGVAVIMAISRVYLGEHWSSDVIGGIFLGAGFGLLAMVYYD